MSKDSREQGKAELDERKLVKDCLKGDKKAWDAFVEAYQGLIYNAIIRALLLAGRTGDDNVKNDLFQDVFTLLLKDDYAKLKSFQWKNGCSLASWLHIVAKNLTYDYLKSRKGKEKVMPLEDNENIACDMTADAGMTFVSGLEEGEAVILLEEALKDLPEEDMRIIDLVFYRHISYAAAAAMLGKSVGAVYMQKKRIIDDLKEKFTKKEKGKI